METEVLTLGFIRTLSGWWLTYPSEKYESQLGYVGILIPYMKWKIIQPCLKPPTRVNSLSITQQATSLFTKRKLWIENRQLQTHMLHGAGIFANICPKKHPVL